MKIVCTIEARMASTRLPGKVLRPILGRPMLERLIERLKGAKRIDEIVIATTTNPACDAIAAFAKEKGICFYRGSEEDVMGRVLQAARSVDGDVIVEMTGDNPLADPETIDRVIEAYLAHKPDYCCNFLENTYPDGMAVQVFGVDVLARAAELTSDPADREHVSLYLYRHPEVFSLYNVRNPNPDSDTSLRLTVDTREDFELAEKLYGNLYREDHHFTLGEIEVFLNQHPELKDINRHIVQKKV